MEAQYPNAVSQMASHLCNSELTSGIVIVDAESEAGERFVGYTEGSICRQDFNTFMMSNLIIVIDNKFGYFTVLKNRWGEQNVTIPLHLLGAFLTHPDLTTSDELENFVPDRMENALEKEVVKDATRTGSNLLLNPW